MSLTPDDLTELEQLEALAERSVQTWLPYKEDFEGPTSISGRIVSVSFAEDRFDASKTTKTVEVDGVDGVLWRVPGYHATLAKELGPVKRGDLVVARFLGKETTAKGTTFWSYRVVSNAKPTAPPDHEALHEAFGDMEDVTPTTDPGEEPF